MPRERKRQEQAKTVMAAYNESEAKRRKESKAAIKMVKGSAKRENTITEQSKKVPGTPEGKVRRHQDNPDDGKELTQRIRELYENGGEKRPSRTKYLTGEIERGNNSRRCDLNSLLQRIIIQPFTIIHNNTISVVQHIPAIRLPIQYTSLPMIAFFYSVPSSNTSGPKYINTSHIQLSSKFRALYRILNPKSLNFTTPLSLSSRLSGLMSYPSVIPQPLTL